MLKIGSVIGLGVMLALLATSVGGLAASDKTFYVATDGNDAWSGTLAEPSKDGSDGPFATLERARDAAREIPTSERKSRRTIVCIRKGTYFLEKPLVLTPEDSHVSYMAYPKEDVVISGGRLIEGFREVEVNGKRMLAADIPEVKQGEWRFTQLFVNNRRRPRTRLPKEGFYRVAELIDVPQDLAWNVGQDKFRFDAADLKAWRNPGDTDIVALHFWIESRMQIKSVDESSKTVHLNKRSTFRLSEDYQPTGARYFVENVFEALDTPGQWYLDRAEGMLYYYPFLGEDTKKMRVIAPALEQLVRVVGDADGDRQVENVRFLNIRFAHTEHMLPANSAGSSQAAVQVPAAIYFERAVNCSVEACEIARIGTYAVEFGQGCKDNRLGGCKMFDMGAGGVKIHPGSEKTTLADNEIGDGGKTFMSAVGVWIANSPGNRVVHNHIHDMYYTGVSVGWVWGYGESKATGNIVEQNHIHHVGRGMLSDLGGIYTLGISPGTKLRHNLIHDCVSHGYGGWGIYTDEGSTGILIENNVVYRTKTGGFHQHYGKENVLRNNVFALSQEQQLQRTRQEPHSSFTFERNIVYFDGGKLLGSNWDDDKFRMDYNVYYDASGRPIDFAGASLEEWRKRGNGVHSVIADPMFVDPKQGDFSLKPGSPAFGLGFKQIDVSNVGPRGAVGPWNGGA